MNSSSCLYFRNASITGTLFCFNQDCFLNVLRNFSLYLSLLERKSKGHEGTKWALEIHLQKLLMQLKH